MTLSHSPLEFRTWALKFPTVRSVVQLSSVEQLHQIVKMVSWTARLRLGISSRRNLCDIIVKDEILILFSPGSYQKEVVQGQGYAIIISPPFLKHISPLSDPMEKNGRRSPRFDMKKGKKRKAFDDSEVAGTTMRRMQHHAQRKPSFDSSTRKLTSFSFGL